MRSIQNILVTGGSGFIGTNFIHYLLKETPFAGKVVNLDSLTYAGNPESLAEIDQTFGGRSYFFEKADIGDAQALSDTFNKYKIDTVIHFAAESHVDRSIHGPAEFIQTNLVGTFTLLETARTTWAGREDCHFHHVSTDEVYGSLGETGFFFEDTPYDPRSPYSASKAGSDHLVNAYAHTYGMSTTISNCSNNYGPYQFPEKLIPLMIQKMLDREALPVYGDGRNIRDWLYVKDHNSAVWEILQRGSKGETYNIGGENEWENIRLVESLCSIVAEETGMESDKPLRELISYVKDRPGHDRRYAINCDKLKNELGWKQQYSFEEGLRSTVRWYLENTQWVEHIQSGAYSRWIEKNYGNRS